MIFLTNFSTSLLCYSRFSLQSLIFQFNPRPQKNIQLRSNLGLKVSNHVNCFFKNQWKKKNNAVLYERVHGKKTKKLISLDVLYNICHKPSKIK